MIHIPLPFILEKRFEMKDVVFSCLSLIFKRGIQVLQHPNPTNQHQQPGVSMMAMPNIAHIEHLFQDLALHVKTLNDFASQLWIAVEHVRETLQEIDNAYKDWKQERHLY